MGRKLNSYCQLWNIVDRMGCTVCISYLEILTSQESWTGVILGHAKNNER